MASHKEEEPRRIPCQERGERRVAQLLQAADAVIAATGYHAATMSAIAEHAQAPIGSLYQFFPSKLALTHALRTKYGEDYDALLAGLEAEAQSLTLDGLSERLVAIGSQFVESHPAFLALLDAPTSTQSTLVLRRKLQRRLARCIMAVRPETDNATALRCASVTLQTIKGLNQLYSEVSTGEKRELLCEYKLALSCYLNARLGADARAHRKLKST